MNGRQRIGEAVAFGAPDRTPVVAQVFGHAARIGGASLGDYVRDGELLASCQLRALERYGYDAVFAFMDAGVESEAAGSVLHYRDDLYPVVRRHVLGDDGPPALPPIPDPHADGRMPEVLKALSILRRQTGGEVLVTGCVLGPMTLAMQLMGAEKALYLAVDHPGRFEQLLDRAADIAVRFGVAQVEAGAHLPMIFDPSASPAVVPPQFFREFELPRLTRMFAAFASAGAESAWLHIAGPVQPILRYYPEAGVQLANFDYCVDPGEAQAALPTICLDGNMKPLDFCESTPESIGRDAAKLQEAFAARGGFVLSSGCEIPPEAKPENVEALVAAARRGGSPCPS